MPPLLATDVQTSGKFRNSSSCVAWLKTILATIIFITLLMGSSSVLHAQTTSTPYCADLSEADCQLVVRAHEMMADIQAMSSQSNIEVIAANIPDFPLDRFELTLEQQTTLAMSEDAFAAQLALMDLLRSDSESLQKDPASLLVHYADLLTGTDLDVSLRLSIPKDVLESLEMAIAEEQDAPFPLPLPDTFTLGARLVDGSVYVNYSSLADMIPGIIARGDIWIGFEFGSLVELIMPVAVEKADFSSVSFEDVAMLSQVFSNMPVSPNGPFAATLAGTPFAEAAVPFLNVERISDDSEAIRNVAYFRSTVDYNSLLTDPTVQDLLVELMRDQDLLKPSASEAEVTQMLVMAQTFGPTLLETLGLEMVEQIEMETGWLLRRELRLDWEIEKLVPIINLAGGPDLSEMGELPDIALNSVTNFDGHNGSVSVPEPDTAILFSMGEILDMMPDEELEQFLASMFMLSSPNLLSAMAAAGLDADLDNASIVATAVEPYSAVGPDKADVGATSDTQVNTQDAPELENATAADLEPSLADLEAEAGALMKAENYATAIPIFDTLIASNPGKVEYYSERGRAYLNSGDYEQALEDLMNAIDMVPTADRYNMAGLSMVRLGQTEEAINAYSESIKLDPTFIFPYFNRGRVYYRQEQFDRAIADYSATIGLDPDHSSAYYVRGLTYHRMENHGRAQLDLEKAVQINPQADAYNILGLTLDKLGEADQAFNAYEAAIELDPEYVFPYYNVGAIYARNGEFTMAIEHYSVAIELNPDYIDALFYRGQAYIRLSEYELAVQDYNTLLEINPEIAPAYVNRGDAFTGLKDFEAGMADYKQALEIDPKFPLAFYRSAQAYVQMGKLDKARVNFTAAIELAPRYVEALEGRSNLYVELEEFALAVADYTTLLDLDPNAKTIYSQRGDAYYQLNDMEAALADFNEALAFNPDDAETYVSRGLVYYALEDLEAEIADYSSAIELTPEYTTAYYYRAQSYEDLSESELALADYDKAIDLDPTYSDAYWSRGMLFKEYGNLTEALKDLERYLELVPDTSDADDVRKTIEEIKEALE